MNRTKGEMMKSLTREYLGMLDPDNLPDPLEIEQEIVNRVKGAFAAENQVREKGDRWPLPQVLDFAQLADILLTLYPIRKISRSNQSHEYDLLAIYESEGPKAGIYNTDQDRLYRLACEYRYSLTENEFEEVLHILNVEAKQINRCLDKNLIAVNNGIFNYKTKELLPFTPDLAFLTKSGVDYNPNAKCVNIHNDLDDTDWDIESWFSSLSDDPDIVTLLWQITGAIIRPNNRWNKSAWLYSTVGNNGKGTLCELLRNLCGNDAYAAIPIADFSKEFLLEPLTRASAVIVDENDVGQYIDRAANLKAVITNDVIWINRKFKQPVAYQFYGFMVQCLNELPRIRDKSDSFYRRQIFVPFEKTFTGVERKYIKDDYLSRKEVLEYVLYKVLNMDYEVLSEPESCKNLLSEYKEFNDPVRQFWNELSSSFVWDLLPFNFLYELYMKWYKINNPEGKPQAKATFITDIVSVMNPDKDNPEWIFKGRDHKVRTKHLMDVPETLIFEYGLDNWKNKLYAGNDVNKIVDFIRSDSYRGIVRYIPGVTDKDLDDTDTNTTTTKTTDTTTTTTTIDEGDTDGT